MGVVETLRSARLQIVRFLNRSSPFEHLTLRAVRRECVIKDGEFVIRVVGQCLHVEPGLEEWLLTRPFPALRPKGNGFYWRRLAPNIRLMFYNEGAAMSQRWFIGYEIVCKVPGLVRDETAEHKEQWLLKTVWRQIMASNRLRDWHRRQL